MKKFYFLIIYILSIIIISCQEKVPDEIEIDQPVETDTTDIPLKSAELVSASNAFGFDIFRLILEDESNNKNIFISPTSISLALAMALNGANNATEDSMAYALRVSDMTNDEINVAFRELMSDLTTVDEKVTLTIANSIWYRMGLPVESSFLSTISEYYDAMISAIDFSSPEAVDIINNWCAENTNNRIPEIITEIDYDQVMFLINAIYFKGIWKTGFDPGNTIDDYFYPESGTQGTVKMMVMEDTLSYCYNELFAACELNYGLGNYGMIVLLPHWDIPLEDIADQLTPENWSNWMTSLDSQWVKLSLPKFTFSYEKSLNEILSLMGMGIAFDQEQADFTGISMSRSIYIDKVMHNTFVEVNEEGTEAAAVTTVVFDVTSEDPNGPRKMTVNRPFLFIIHEKSTKAIVFIGKVAKPVIEVSDN